MHPKAKIQWPDKQVHSCPERGVKILTKKVTTVDEDFLFDQAVLQSNLACEGFSSITEIKHASDHFWYQLSKIQNLDKRCKFSSGLNIYQKQTLELLIKSLHKLQNNIEITDENSSLIDLAQHCINQANQIKSECANSSVG